MPEVHFWHEFIEGGKPLVIETGIDEVAWSYRLNTASFPTYGGEVIQILSVFIDDLKVSGTVAQYDDAERIYRFFMRYFTIATQGASAATSSLKYEQKPMVFSYPHRGWVMEIQPLKAPGFTYATETVTPTWQMQAHVVDDSPNVDDLKELVSLSAGELGSLENVTAVPHGTNSFKLTGVIAPDMGDPAQNPFVAPGKVGLGEKFNPAEGKAVTEGLGKIADYYNHLLPSYLGGDFSNVVTEIGAKPAFGRPTEPGHETDEGTKGVTQGAPENELTVKATAK